MQAGRLGASLCAVGLAGLAAASGALASRPATRPERLAVVSGLPRFYDQTCIRAAVRISTVDGRFASVVFHFTSAKESSTCHPFDGQVLMRRVAPARWRPAGEGSSWSCRTPGVSAGVIRDLFGSCL